MIPSPRRPLTVGELTRIVRGALSVRPELEDVLVEGEIANLRSPGSGHLYFTLRDRESQCRCVCFRSQAAAIPFHPEAGMTVVARGRVDVYEADGTYQLYVERLDPSGIGAIALAVEQRRRRLAAEGLFDGARKRRLPVLPRRIAVVTSSTGAAVRDVVTVARRRAPGVGVVVVPTPVQGDGAEASIIRALGSAGSLPGVDVILLVRGGGSMEDLVAFQDEGVARAVAASPVPVVTGIGHETDTTIADLVADRRGATPSNAAELAVPDAAGLRQEILARVDAMRGALRSQLGARRRALDAGRERLRLVSPERRLPAMRQALDGRLAALRAATLSGVAARHRRLDGAVTALRLASPARRVPAEREALLRRRRGLAAGMARLTEGRRADLRTAVGRLDALSPLRVLDRGYSITALEDGTIVHNPEQAPPGTGLVTRVAGGDLHSRVGQ